MPFPSTISAAGISPSGEKVQAIKDAAPVMCVSKWQSFLGSANFLRKFVPDFAKIALTLYSLLSKEAPWKWSKTEQVAFDSIKAVLCIFRFYSSSLRSHSWASSTVWYMHISHCRTSWVKLGAVCNLDQIVHYNQDTKHTMPDKITLKLSASPYPLLGRHFKLLTDHKPLIILFGEHSCLCPSWQQQESKGDGHYF